MNYTRVFTTQDFISNEQITLSGDNFKHLSNVLRKKIGSLIQLFDGQGSSCIGKIISFNRQSLSLKITEKRKFKPRQGIKIFLGQSLIKSESFRFSIQKATELGVCSISPLLSERTVIKINEDSVETKLKKWKSISVGACQQCGEDWIPHIHKAQSIESWVNQIKAKYKIVLFPSADKKLSSLKIKDSVAVAVGPEGDFTDLEVSLLEQRGFIPVNIGPRILRSDTATISTLSSIRTMCGEF